MFAINLPVFDFELRGGYSSAAHLLDYLSFSKVSIPVHVETLETLRCVLANLHLGREILIPNLSRKTHGRIFQRVFDQLVKHEFIERIGTGRQAGRIIFLDSILEFKPKMVERNLEHTIFTNANGKRESMKLTTEFRRDLNRRMKTYWEFIGQKSITVEKGFESAFSIINNFQQLALNKKPINYPNFFKVKPYFSFNDEHMERGGRMYGAWWIGLPKNLRKGILINGEETSDIDGCGMHVQLLYLKAGIPIPDQLYPGANRSIAKGLMLLLMNTKKDYTDIEKGRKAVSLTYGRGEWENIPHNERIAILRRLEEFHAPILKYLYKSNWGELQRMEAQLMLQIMELAMQDNILVLPIHDGCLCQRQHRDKVLGYFDQVDIRAKENLKHLEPIPLKEMSQAVDLIVESQKYIAIVKEEK